MLIIIGKVMFQMLLFEGSSKSDFFAKVRKHREQIALLALNRYEVFEILEVLNYYNVIFIQFGHTKL
jgi:hypothetical protein